MIKEAKEVRKITEQNDLYQEKINKAVSYIIKDIEYASNQGMSSTCFSCSYDIREDVKVLFLEKGYSFRPTGYIGGVLQNTEQITW